MLLHTKAIAALFASCIIYSYSSFAETLQQEKEYVVTASLSPILQSNVGSSVTIISAADLQKRGVTFLSDILREVPGLAVSRSGTFGTQTDIRVRGAEANHTLVLIDGVEVNDPALGSSFQFGFLTAANIDRIEIVRGAQSALWGSDAIGATINIITRQDIKPFALNADFSGGSFNTKQSSVHGALGNAIFNINVNADILRTDGTNIARFGDEDDGSLQRVYDLKAAWTPNPLFDFSYSRRTVKARTQTDPQLSGIVIDASGNQTKTDQVHQKLSASLSLLDNRWVNRFSYTSSKNSTHFSSSTYSPSFQNGKKQKYTVQSDLALQQKTRWRISQHISTLFEHEDNDAIGTYIGGDNVVGFTTQSYAIEHRLGVLEQFFVSTGLRYDNNDNFFQDKVTYRVTGTGKIPQYRSRIHLSYGTGIKNPTISELFGNYPNFTGNPDLTPETARGWDIGIEKNWFDNALTADITYFKNLISNQITGYISANGNTVANSVGTNAIDGIEASISVSALDVFQITGNYTYTRSHDANDLELLRRPRHIGNLNINYRQNKMNINMGIYYGGQQQDIVYPAYPQPSFRTNLGSYTLVNVAARYDLNQSISVYGKIENLFNKSYADVFSYSAPGIGAYAGINVKLNP